MDRFFGSGLSVRCLRIVFLVTVCTPLAVEAQVPAVVFSSGPEHAVLFVIDGLSYKVWDRLRIPTLRRLAREGALVERDYLPPPADPRTGAYAELHSCSIPNPILMSGTVFITKETGYIRQCFPTSEATAFVANTTAYTSIAAGYEYSYQQEGADDESVRSALAFMRTGRPRFMRVHLQNPGSAGFECMTTKKDVDWRSDIWAADSPYRIATERADSLLEVFLEGLNKLGVLEKTVIIVLGDHGQDDGGWHPLQSPDAAITTMVLWGAGIKGNIRVPYAEHIDIVPTICALMGVEPPKTSQGRVIAETLARFNGAVEPRAYRIKELNGQLFEYQKSLAEILYALGQLPSPKQGSFHYRLDAIRQNFYDIYRFTEWPRLRTLDNLLTNNQTELEELRELLKEVRGAR